MFIEYMTIQILLVEDDLNNLKLLNLILKSRFPSFRVYNATTINDAKDQLAKYNFHLMITDINLPDGYGYDLLNYVNSSMVVIGVSGEDLKPEFKEKFDVFIEKPIEIKKLTEVITEFTVKIK
jgi:two-component system, NtrC family, response regulator PilR